MNTSTRTLIVGAGLGGLTLAQALTRSGAPFTLIERSPDFSRLGAGIMLHTNAMLVLARLGLAEQVKAQGLTMDKMQITDASGRLLQSVALRPFAHLAPSISVHRAALHRVLRQGLEIQLATPLTALERRPEGAWEAFTQDGRSLGCFDRIIGADGLHSQVRRLVAPQAPAPRSMRSTCWRAVIPDTQQLTSPIEMWGRRQRLGLVPLGQGLVYLYLVDKEPAEGNSDAALAQRFAGFGGPGREALAQLGPQTQVLRHALCSMRGACFHPRPGVALLGDAAHAFTPNMGQGAAMAMEDAWALANSLLLAPQSALRRYQEERLPRVRQIARASDLIGEVAQLPLGPATWCRDRLMALAPARLQQRQQAQTLTQGPTERHLLEREVEPPLSQTWGRSLERVDYEDSFALTLPQGEPLDLEGFLARWRRGPAWIQALLKLRHALVKPLGLCTQGEVLPVLERGESSVWMGQDDKHLDFRVQVLRQSSPLGVQRFVVTTQVHLHASLGRLYFALVRPFHRRVVASLLQQTARGA